MITGLGVLIGVPVGFAIAEGPVRAGAPIASVGTFVGSDGGMPMPLIIPWLDLGALAVAVPLLTTLGAALLSRSKAPGSGRWSIEPRDRGSRAIKCLK
jgi:putative ABC transport system permease protein